MRIVFEKVRDSGESSFVCRDEKAAVFSCPYHVHPEIEILQILGGQGQLVVGDHAGRFQPGQLMLLGDGLPHMLCSDAAPPGPDNDTRLRYIQFRPQDFGDRFWALRELQPATRLLDEGSRGLMFGPGSIAAARTLMDRLWAVSGSTRLLTLLELLDCLARDRDRQPMASLGYAPAVSHRDSVRLTRVLQYINSHIADTLALADIATKAGLSAQAFGRFFRKRVGMSCIDYVIAQRISLACRHLLETDQSIATVAFLVGFNNLSNFNRQFRRLKGIAPKDYRRQALTGLRRG